MSANDLFKFLSRNHEVYLTYLLVLFCFGLFLLRTYSYFNAESVYFKLVRYILSFWLSAILIPS